MSAVPASTNLSTLSDLLTQLQDLHNSDLRLLESQEHIKIRKEREPWDHIKGLISHVLLDPQLQGHTGLQDTLIKCKQTLTQLRLYGDTDPGHHMITYLQIQSVYNQLVDHIKSVYTLDDTQSARTSHIYSSEIDIYLQHIVSEIVAIGVREHFIKHIELETQSQWKAIMIRQLKFGLGYKMYSNRSSSADSLRRLSDLCQDLDREFTRFIERPTAPNIYYAMVAYIHNFYTPENIAPLNPLDRKNLNIVVICLLCYGRHYMHDNFKLRMLEEIDTSYWQYANPLGHGTHTDIPVRSRARFPIFY